MKGQGIAKDAKQAVNWYTKAAERGHARAQFLLGRLYYAGRAVPLDYKQALNWLTKAANQRSRRGSVGVRHNVRNG